MPLPRMYYHHAEFGRSTSKIMDISKGTPKIVAHWGTPNPRDRGMSDGDPLRTHPSPMWVTRPHLITVGQTVRTYVQYVDRPENWVSRVPPFKVTQGYLN